MTRDELLETACRLALGTMDRDLARIEEDRVDAAPAVLPHEEPEAADAERLAERRAALAAVVGPITGRENLPRPGGWAPAFDPITIRSELTDAELAAVERVATSLRTLAPFGLEVRVRARLAGAEKEADDPRLAEAVAAAELADPPAGRGPVA